jgi:hypothetical protein
LFCPHFPPILHAGTHRSFPSFFFILAASGLCFCRIN